MGQTSISDSTVRRHYATHFIISLLRFLARSRRYRSISFWKPGDRRDVFQFFQSERLSFRSVVPLVLEVAPQFVVARPFVVPAAAR